MALKNEYLIESLAPLVFRSGKPFGAHASALDVIFPLPSAAAGLVRAIGIGQGKLDFKEQRLSSVQNTEYQKVLSVAVQGPFLVRYDQQGQYEVLVAKPADALYFENRESGQTELVRLVPKAFDDKICGSDLPEGLLPVQMLKNLKGKPQGGVSFWTLAHVERWQNGEELSFENVQHAGLSHLPVDIRTHVAIDSVSKATFSGKLFQTASLDLAHQRKAEGGWEKQRYGFLVKTDLDLDRDLATFGGERRLSRIERLDQISSSQAPLALLAKINQSKGFSLNFLSPVIFAQGYLPAWIDPRSLEGKLPHSQVRVKLKSVALDHFLAVSGWDSLLWKPKATRKAVRAGSVYWFELIDELDTESLNMMMNTSFSDHDQDQKDGFGVAVVAPWSLTNTQ